MEANGGPGEEEKEAVRDTGIEKDLTNWEKAVDLLGEALGEGKPPMGEENTAV